MRIPTVYIPIGAPGCGKTSYFEDVILPVVYKGKGIVRVSPDAVRLELTGDRNNQDANNRVFKICYTAMQTALEAGQDIYFDATNARLTRIKAIMIQAEQVTPCHFELVRFTASLNRCIEQNKQRAEAGGADVPRPVIYRLFENANEMVEKELDFVKHRYGQAGRSTVRFSSIDPR